MPVGFIIPFDTVTLRQKLHEPDKTTNLPQYHNNSDFLSKSNTFYSITTDKWERVHLSRPDVSSLSHQWCRQSGRAQRASIWCRTMQREVYRFTLVLVADTCKLSFHVLHALVKFNNIFFLNWPNAWFATYLWKTDNHNAQIFPLRILFKLKTKGEKKIRCKITTCRFCRLCAAKALSEESFCVFLSPSTPTCSIFFLFLFFLLIIYDFASSCRTSGITVPVNFLSKVSKYCKYLLLSGVRETALSLFYKPSLGNWLIHHCELFLITVSNDLLMDKVKSIISSYM